MCVCVRARKCGASRLRTHTTRCRLLGAARGLETRNWYGDSIMLSRAGSRSSKSTETSCGARWRSRPGRGAHGVRSACAIGAADLSSGSRDQRPRCEREEEGDGCDWGDEGTAAPEPRGSGATVTGRGRAPGHHCSLLTDRHTVRTRISGSGNGRGDSCPHPLHALRL